MLLLRIIHFQKVENIKDFGSIMHCNGNIAMMDILRDWQPPSTGKMAMTIGNFDGVHLGHQNLIKKTVRVAKSKGLIPSLMTFYPHPQSFFSPQKKIFRIFSERDKIVKITPLGIERFYLTRFNNDFVNTDARKFAQMLFSNLKVDYLAVGEDFCFGKGRKGNFSLLRQVASDYGAEVEAVSLITAGGEVISSGRVRKALSSGHFFKVAHLLGGYWTMTGRVYGGDGRGRSLGYPTANVALNFTPPVKGIFAAWARFDNRCYLAAVSIGTNPTVKDESSLTVEAHLLDFNENIYGKRLSLELVCKLREEKKYTSVLLLKKAIDEDILHVRETLEKARYVASH